MHEGVQGLSQCCIEHIEGWRQQTLMELGELESYTVELVLLPKDPHNICDFYWFKVLSPSIPNCVPYCVFTILADAGSSAAWSCLLRGQFVHSDFLSRGRTVAERNSLRSVSHQLAG